jgi:hypothetical protein
MTCPPFLMNLSAQSKLGNWEEGCADMKKINNIMHRAGSQRRKI